jgi:hypothetical protein
LSLSRRRLAYFRCHSAQLLARNDSVFIHIYFFLDILLNGFLAIEFLLDVMLCKTLGSALKAARNDSGSKQGAFATAAK